MRESIGGAWLFGIVITFIFMFSAFLAYSVSYTKAFNVKNEVVNIIEQNMGLNNQDVDYNDVSESDTTHVGTAHWKVFRAIKNAGYNSQVASRIECASGDDMRGRDLDESGVCIIKYCSNGSRNNTTNVHYKVTTYIAIEIPVIQVVFKIPITGETNTIYTDLTGFPCGDDPDANWN